MEPPEPLRRRLKRGLYSHLLPVLAHLAINALAATWRWRVRGMRHLVACRRHGGPVIGAFWHGRLSHLVLFMNRFGGIRWTAMISTSLDGELQARVLDFMHYRVVRGSAGRGGARALLGMLRLLRDERDCRLCLAVDGSRGPRGRVKPGVIALAAKSGAWILPTASAAKRCLVFRSWDRFALPLPFSPVQVVMRRPFTVPPRLTEAEAEHWRLHLEDELARAYREAAARVGFRPAFAEIGEELPREARA